MQKIQKIYNLDENDQPKAAKTPVTTETVAPPENNDIQSRNGKIAAKDFDIVDEEKTGQLPSHKFEALLEELSIFGPD